MRRAALSAAAALALALAASASAAAPRPDEALPRDPQRLAHRLAAATRDALAGRELARNALYEQRAVRALAADQRLAAATLRLLPSGVARATRSLVAAGRELHALSTPRPLSAIRTGAPAPPSALRRWYGEAQRRFGVDWRLLAAVELVESRYGRLRNESTAGARGPMQFMPSTWRAYGLGGDVQDQHDAILGAANYLHAAGAPGNERRALYAYNRSYAYVDAVLRYASLMRRDARWFRVLHAWQVFVRTPSGELRVTGEGR